MSDTFVSSPQPVPQEEPAVNIQSLLDQQAAQFESQMSEVRAQAAETLRQQKESANDIIAARLSDYGLESLGGFVSNLVFTEGVVDTNIIMGRLRATPEYKQRFAGNEQRRKAGLNVLSEGEYVALENSYRQLMRQSGLPTGFYDSNDDFQNLIANDVSPGEFAERVNQGYEAVRFADPTVIAQMQELYGVSEGDLAAYFLDPEKATPILLQRAQAAQTAAGAAQAGMQLTTEEAERLAQEGITQQQARAGAAAITQAEELFQPTTGEQDGAFTREEQLGAVFGTDPAAAQRLRQRQRRRQAAFEGGGGFAQGAGGQVTGLQ